MRLAGIGWPEDGGNARAGHAIIRERGRREGHAVQVFLASLTLSQFRHPEVLAQRASKDARPR